MLLLKKEKMNRVEKGERIRTREKEPKERGKKVATLVIGWVASD